MMQTVVFQVLWALEICLENVVDFENAIAISSLRFNVTAVIYENVLPLTDRLTDRQKDRQTC